MQAITRKITPRTTRPERIDILPSPARILLAHDLVRKPGPTFRDHALRRAHLRPASIKFQAPREPVGCHDVARVGADAPPWVRYGRGGHGYARPHHRRKDVRAAAGDRRRPGHGAIDADLPDLTAARLHSAARVRAPRPR